MPSGDYVEVINNGAVVDNTNPLPTSVAAGAQNDLTDKPTRQLGIVSVTGTPTVDVTDKAGRQVGIVSITGVVTANAQLQLNDGAANWFNARHASHGDGLGGTGIQSIVLEVLNPAGTGFDRVREPNGDGVVINGIPGIIGMLLNSAGTFDRPRGDATTGQRVSHHSSILEVNVAGGAAAAATLTLPAPGAGLFQYITFLRIARVATAALAGAAILAVTTTNLNGQQYRCGNAMVAGGTDALINVAFSSPLKAAAANAAVTFVGPAPGAAVSWDMQASYYVGP